jgi:hypothetical protein
MFIPASTESSWCICNSLDGTEFSLVYVQFWQQNNVQPRQAVYIRNHCHDWCDSHIGGRTDPHIVYEAFTPLKRLRCIRSHNSHPESHNIYRGTSLCESSSHSLREEYFEAAFSSHPITPYFDWRNGETEESIHQSCIFSREVFTLCGIFHWRDYYGFSFNKNYRRNDLRHAFPSFSIFEKLIINIQDLCRYGITNFYSGIIQMQWLMPLFYISLFKYFQHSKEVFLVLWALKQASDICSYRLWTKITSKSYANLKPRIKLWLLYYFWRKLKKFPLYIHYFE